MKQYKNMRKTIKILDRVICDRCKKVLKKDSLDNVEGGTLSISFGYDSDYDLESYDADICDNCFKKVLRKFMVPR